MPVAVLELLHPGQHGQVLLVAQLLVVTELVPRVEGVEPDDVEGLQVARPQAPGRGRRAGRVEQGLTLAQSPPPPTSGGRANLLNFIIRYMYSVGEGGSPPLGGHPEGQPQSGPRRPPNQPASPSWPQDMRTFSSPQ